jgi:hypothetical protein
VFPTNIDSVNNLLRRNWYQVAWTNAVYAVGRIDERYRIDGGTAWAVQMYIDRFICDGEDPKTCRLYFFNEISRKWLKWENEWRVLEELPPMPSGLWTGIGTRKLTLDGQSAIEHVTTQRTSAIL